MGEPATVQDIANLGSTKVKWSFLRNLRTDEMTTSALLSVVFAAVGTVFWNPWDTAILTAICLTWLGMSFSLIWDGIRTQAWRDIGAGVLFGVLCGYVFYVPNQDAIHKNFSAVAAILTLYVSGFVFAFVKAIVKGGSES